MLLDTTTRFVGHTPFAPGRLFAVGVWTRTQTMLKQTPLTCSEAVKMATTTKAPPVQSFAHWTLVSSDVARTKRFYTEVLGAKPLRDGGGGGPTAVALANTTVDFFEAHEGQQPSPGSGGQHHAYRIRLQDFDPWLEHFKGEEVPVRVTAGDGRLSIRLDDPDGYHLEFTVAFENREQGIQEIKRRGLTRTGVAQPGD